MHGFTAMLKNLEGLKLEVYGYSQKGNSNMPYKEKGKKTWRAKVTYQGKQYTKRCRTKKEAMEWERERWKYLKKRQIGTDSLIHVSNKYLDYCEMQFNRTTYLNKKKTLQELISIVGNLPIHQVESETILHDILMPQKTTSLYNKRRKDLRAFFEYAKDFHGLRLNPVVPIKKIPRERENQPMPTHGELAKLLENMLPGQDKRMIIFFSECGARKSEGLRLTWSNDIDFINREIRLGSRKNRARILKYRYVPMTEKSYDILKKQLKEKLPDNDYVFQNRAVWKDKKGNIVRKHPNYGERFTARRKFIQGVCKKAEIKHFGFHGLRRYYASNLVSEGLDLETIRERLGHSAVSVTDRYILRIKDDLKQSVHENST